MPLQEPSLADNRAASQALFRLAILTLLSELLFLMAWMVLTERLWSQHVQYLSWAERTLANLASLVAAGVAYSALFGLLTARRGALTTCLTGRAPKVEIVGALKIAASRLLSAVCAIAFVAFVCSPEWLWAIPLLVVSIVWFWLHLSIRKEMRRLISAPPPHDAIRDRVLHLKQLAGQMGLGNIPIRVIEPFPWPLTLAACGTVKKREDWIFLSRTPLALLDDREMMAILAHEVAHCCLGHTRGQSIKSAVSHGVLIAILAGLILWSAGPSPAEWSFLPGLPRLFLALSLISLLIRPVTAAIHRRAERAANRRALESTADPAAFISALTKLARYVGGDRPLCWWERMIAAAPSLEDITKQAQQFARERGIRLEASPSG